LGLIAGLGGISDFGTAAANAFIMPALFTIAGPPEWRVSWKRTWRGMGLAQSAFFPQPGQRSARSVSEPALAPPTVRGAAAVLVALEQARARDGGAEHAVESQLARVHRAVRLREEQLPRRGAERVLEVRPEPIGNGDCSSTAPARSCEGECHVAGIATGGCRLAAS
jgi:hypothetical protein